MSLLTQQENGKGVVIRYYDYIVTNRVHFGLRREKGLFVICPDRSHR